MAAAAAGAGIFEPPTAALYVGDVEAQVTEAQLIDIFSGFHGYLSASLVRNSSSLTNNGGPRCYAYVNFSTLEQARQAMEATNHRVVNGKAIRVMEAQSNAETRTSGIGNIFVKNLHDSIDNAKLEEIFSKYGRILSCKVTVSEDGNSKGYGFVQFESPESASLAIESADGSIVEGKKLSVSKFMRKEERFNPENPEEYRNLYFKNLDDNVSEEILRERFSKFGEITSLLVSKDEDGRSKGFGFVNFKETAAAQQAQRSMNMIQFGSKVLYVARAQKKSERQQSLRQQSEQRSEWLQKYKNCNLYVKNINDGVDDAQLRDHFSKIGSVVATRIMRTENGVSKGFGFVCLSTVDEAAKSVTLLNGSLFHGKPLYVAIAQTKEERRRFLEAVHAKRNAAAPPFPIPPFAFPPFLPPPPPFLHQPPFPFPPRFPPMPGFTFPPPLLPNHIANCMGRPPLPFRRQGRFGNAGAMFRRPGFAPMAANRVLPPQGKPDEKSRRDSNLSEEEDWSSHLAAATPQRREEMIWDRLLPLVQKLKGELAPRITRILMELDHAEQLVLLESAESLAAKVEEAENTINQTSNN
ncbi:unnamed protein product [Linum tenue]|uniref:Polyadenylate-binding protein n=1 Tax=Linum tenue TaxID=586396 RepID=A0AAV0N2C5_9ROSI|nr:unnamed protein product [Linum tenue]